MDELDTPMTLREWFQFIVGALAFIAVLGFVGGLEVGTLRFTP